MTLVGNRALPELLCLYRPEGAAHCIEIESGNCVDILQGINLGRDWIVWCEWHPASASGHHVSLLTAHCTFFLANALTGKIESRLRIRSPDDFTLKCETAALAGDVLWIFMENGDILAMSPVLPYPCSSAPIIAKSHHANPNDSMLQRFIAEFSRHSQKSAVVDKMQRSLVATPPAIQGPFLIQPEPLEYSGVRTLVPFGYSGLDLLMLVFNENRIDISLLERPVMPLWMDDSSRDPPILTLMESIIIDGLIQSATPIPGSSDLLVVQSNSVKLVALEWVGDILAYLQEGADSARPPTCVSKITQVFSDASKTIVSSFLLGRSLTVVFDDGCKRTVNILPSKRVLNIGSLLATPVLSSPFVLPSTQVAPPHTFGIHLPKLEIPAEIRSRRFPEDLDENSLEKVLMIVHEWRLQMIAKCALLGEELRRKILVVGELAQGQHKWAEQTISRAEALLKVIYASDLALADMDRASASMDQRLLDVTGPSRHHRQAHELQLRVSRIRNALGKILRSPKLAEKIRSQMQMIEQMQAQIEKINIGA